MYKLKGVYEIMEIKKILNLLANQYVKSFKRFESIYSPMLDFKKQVKEFNKGYLKLISAVLNSGDPDQIRANLHSSLVYIHATENDQTKLNEELY